MKSYRKIKENDNGESKFYTFTTPQKERKATLASWESSKSSLFDFAIKPRRGPESFDNL